MRTAEPSPCAQPADHSAGSRDNLDGIRMVKASTSGVIQYLLNGGDVVGEVRNGAVETTYLRGVNLISKTGTATEFYSFNAHGDVVNLTNASGASTKSYTYDAFGNEKNKQTSDANPFRYCGEYWDKESQTYYLRARYYDPSIGRFTQEDTHWSPENCIYGDEPQQIGEYQDALGVSRYCFFPSRNSINQSSKRRETNELAVVYI